MSAPISREAAQQLSPVEALRRLALETLSECGEGYCLSLRGFLSRCGARIHPEIVRGIMADLRQDGLVAHCRGLMTEDGEMAGSGWGITPAGQAHLRALPRPVAPAMKEAAVAMKVAWDADLAHRDLVLAACFAGAAHEAALTSPLTADGAPTALLGAFLTALIDPMSADLDYLRADPASGEAARSDGPETTA
ncbi:hypothetical protein [Falsigemmobacter faecalis]|uniref:Uncharacterized protein n=1 Tax=Falsigemmobacter faecalis TaxID=2488730 RepID=A0A3P3D6R3_9RHOB|nr:hypothetical protein [Falsigemmobacter faecalis]RRH70033.1 hypothetical protein EG244_17640 [Falsigemmobacter faecalis]